MSASVHAPAVDEGEPPAGLAAVWRELAPQPGRLGNTLRLVVLVLASVAISETFRLPDAAVSAYVVLFLSRGERASTVMTAVVAGSALIVAVFATIVVFMASLSEPALRVPLIAAFTFLALFLSRASPLGPVAFAAGFIMAYGLTSGDEVLGVSLQAATISNTTGGALPEFLFVPPEEALLHAMLWLALVIAMPVALVVVGNLLTGRDPAVLLRDGLAERLEAAAAYCADRPGATRRLADLAREGTAGLQKLHHLAGRHTPVSVRLIEEAGRLALVLLAWERLGPESVGLENARAACEQAALAVHGGVPPAAAISLDIPDEASRRPLTAELVRSLQSIQAALAGPVEPAAKPAARAPRRLLVADAWSNPEHVRFALKATLAVMLCYAAEDLLDWPAIHTCVVTCFFVSLGTIGESVHKAGLRIGGAVAGGALGIGTILLLMPLMTDLGQLLAALGAVTLLAGWVACGSERISYAGWQIGLAYYLTVLQGDGPTLDMQTARDRVIGVVLGNLAVLAIFTTLWPVGVGRAVRRSLETALRQLAALMALEEHTPEAAAAEEPALRQGFATAMSGATSLLVNARFEPGGQSVRPIDAGAVADLQALMVPVAVILRLRSDPVWQDVPPTSRNAVLAHHHAMAGWFARCADWVQTGTGGDTLAAELPLPPGLAGEGVVATHLAARTTWYEILHRDIASILRSVMPAIGRHPGEGARSCRGLT